MKKIFAICAAIMAAMTMNAQQVMTCEAASTAALALPATDGKSTLDDTNSIDVILTGYVTSTNGNVSKGQQSFYMGDVKGEEGPINAYWANLPADDQTPLNVGDQVSLSGRVFNYNGTVAEIKNGTLTILERVVIVRDTTDVSVCDAIEIGEALNNNEVSDDYYIVEGVVTMAKAANTNYNNQTFDFTCEGNEKILEGYNVTFKDNEYCAVGDTVRILGRLTNYQGTKIEFNGGKAEVIGKAPIVYVPQIINATVAEAIAAGMELAKGAYSVDTFVVTGYCDSIATVYSEQYKNISFFLCDDMADAHFNFEGYRVAGGAELKVGDQVTIQGVLQHYYKAAVGTEGEAGYKPEIDLIELCNGFFVTPTGIFEMKQNVRVEKVIRDGKVIIRMGEKNLSVMGQRL